jgi:DNA-binding transcriptional LysR family regulator
MRIIHGGMDRAQLPLNALRAFEASARHLNFTRAASELFVSQGAVSHQVAALEKRLGTPLFRRLPRGLALTDEGQALVPVLAETFDRIGATLDRFAGGRLQHPLAIGVVGTFATGWLLPRLERFAARHPHVDVRLSINNNRVDLAGDAWRAERRQRCGKQPRRSGRRGDRRRDPLRGRRMARHACRTAACRTADAALRATHRRAVA